MAHMHLENRLFSDRRVRELAGALNLPHNVTIGILTSFWHPSQDALLLKASRKKIERWLRDEILFLKETRPDVCLFDLLVETGWLHKDGGEYLIEGNEKRIRVIGKAKEQCKLMTEKRLTKKEKLYENYAKNNNRNDNNDLNPSVQNTVSLGVFAKQNPLHREPYSEPCHETHRTENIEHRTEIHRTENRDILIDLKIDAAPPPEDTALPEISSEPSQVKKIKISATALKERSKPQTLKEALARSAEQKQPNGTFQFIEAYKAAYKETYTQEPPIEGSDWGIAKTLIKDHTLDRAISYVRAYLKMRDQWFVTKRHDLKTLKGSIKAVALFAEAGLSISKNQARTAEVAHANDLAVEAYLAKRQRESEAVNG